LLQNARKKSITAIKKINDVKDVYVVVFFVKLYLLLYDLIWVRLKPQVGYYPKEIVFISKGIGV